VKLLQVLALFVFLVPYANAQVLGQKVIPAYDMRATDKGVKQLYQKIPQSNSADLLTRLKAHSAYFLGKPYVLGPLGEGPEARFDQEPLYRLDVFDCFTYVTTVMALACSDNLAQFQQHFKQLAYKDGRVTFVDRNHFTSLDWNNNLAALGYLKDITPEIKDKNGRPVAKFAETLINKPAWYRHMSAANLRLLKSHSQKELRQLAKELQTQANKVKSEKISQAYLPLTALFDKKGKPNQFLFDQIPSGSVIEIIRPNWNLKDKIGTNLNVSHLGFGIRTTKGLMYREASSIENKVIDIPLTQYLKAYLKSPTVKGINVQLVLG